MGVCFNLTHFKASADGNGEDDDEQGNEEGEEGGEEEPREHDAIVEFAGEDKCPDTQVDAASVVLCEEDQQMSAGIMGGIMGEEEDTEQEEWEETWEEEDPEHDHEVQVTDEELGRGKISAELENAELISMDEQYSKKLWQSDVQQANMKDDKLQADAEYSKKIQESEFAKVNQDPSVDRIAYLQGLLSQLKKQQAKKLGVANAISLYA